MLSLILNYSSTRTSKQYIPSNFIVCLIPWSIDPGNTDSNIPSNRPQEIILNVPPQDESYFLDRERVITHANATSPLGGG